MKDAYSFDDDAESLDISYRSMEQAYRNIYQRCGLSAIMVEADSGAIGGKDSHEFILPAESGEDTIISCSACDYAANSEKAESAKPPMPIEEPLPLEEVATPGATTIATLCDFLGVPESRTLKAVFYKADDDVVFVVLRGDLEVNEVKLRNLLGCNELRLATDEEVTQAGIVAGFASPMGLKGVKRIADDSIRLGSNFVAGANREGYHAKNVNHPRDFQVDESADIALAEAGHGCPRCEGVLIETRGIEVGHIFKLGTFYSERLGAYYLDEEGRHQPIIMGCYGIGTGRLLAAAIEQHHDDKGIIFPSPIAPYLVHLVVLNVDNGPVREAADALYKALWHNKIETLYDDRVESPGVKFNDADLLGLPLRIVVSPRTLKKGSAELKLRREQEAALVSLDEVLTRAKEIISGQ
jgi:prolyl-tRNA synthetase